MCVGLFVMLAGVVYGSMCTKFFGYHWFPTSYEELVTDGLTIIIAALGLIIFCMGYALSERG